MNKSDVIHRLYEIEAIKLGTFTLKSGIISPIYVDLRQIITYPKLMQAIAYLMWEQVKHLPISLFCGVPYTALPIATCLSLQLDKPMLIVRKEAKTYGTKKMIEGLYHANDICLIIEDVVTSGSSVLNVLEQLNQENIKAPYVVSFLDREQAGREALTQAGCQFFSVVTLSEIITALKKSGIQIPAI